MKKCTKARKLHHLRVSRYHLTKIHKKRANLFRLKNKEQEKLKKASANYIIKLITPEKFNLMSDHEERENLLKLIAKLRKLYGKQKVLVELNFRKTKKMHAEATLYFLAELDTLINLNPTIQFEVTLAKNEIVNQVLFQTGILKLLKVRTVFKEANFDNSVKYWSYASGKTADVDSKTKALLRDVSSLIGSDAVSSRRSMFKVITEAMTNCRQHAYEETRSKSFIYNYSVKKWWMFSRYTDGVLDICVCDLGMGIPRSISAISADVEESWKKRLKGFVEKWRIGFNIDSALLKAAVKIGNTRTKLPNRGKGLAQIISELDKIPECKTSVAILSNKGGYIMQRTNTEKEVLLPYNDSIYGTIISWRIERINADIAA